MPIYTINRTGKIEQALGIGEGRITEGRIDQKWTAAERSIPAASLGLKSISNLVLTGGTAGIDCSAHARIVSPGSLGNTARVRTYMKQDGYTRVGTPRYVLFAPVYSSTPTIILGIGSPTARTIGTYEPRLSSARGGSFATVGSPTFANCPYLATGPGSYPINFIATGQ